MLNCEKLLLWGLYGTQQGLFSTKTRTLPTCLFKYNSHTLCSKQSVKVNFFFGSLVLQDICDTDCVWHGMVLQGMVCWAKVVLTGADVQTFEPEVV